MLLFDYDTKIGKIFLICKLFYGFNLIFFRIRIEIFLPLEDNHSIGNNVALVADVVVAAFRDNGIVSFSTIVLVEFCRGNVCGSLGTIRVHTFFYHFTNYLSTNAGEIIQQVSVHFEGKLAILIEFNPHKLERS